MTSQSFPTFTDACRNFCPLGNLGKIHRDNLLRQTDALFCLLFRIFCTMPAITKKHGNDFTCFESSMSVLSHLIQTHSLRILSIAFVINVFSAMNVVLKLVLHAFEYVRYETKVISKIQIFKTAVVNSNYTAFI